MARTVYPTATAFVPASTDLPQLADAAASCQGCNLYADATQVVFGQGRSTARLMLVGEQPGDVEDQRGRPFVGPAGALLGRALKEAGIDGADVYVTNAVKHFRWKATAGSTRRIHAKPDTGHVNACRPWLSAELHAVSAALVVALGATAAQTLLGPSFRVTQERGVLLPWPPDKGPYVGADFGPAQILATIHPSAVLRADPGERDAAFDGLVADLKVAASAVL